MKTLILSLILASAGFMLWRVAMESGPQSAMTRTPELTEHMLSASGSGPICAAHCGTCRCEAPPTDPIYTEGFGTISAEAMAKVQAAGLK